MVPVTCGNVKKYSGFLSEISFPPTLSGTFLPLSLSSSPYEILISLLGLYPRYGSYSGRASWRVSFERYGG